MNGLMPSTTTSTELQRNYRQVVDKIKKLKEPVTVLYNNKPDLVVMDYDVFKNLQQKAKGGETKIKRGLDELFGSWTEKEAKQFDKAIEDAFEKIHSEDWQ